MGKVLTVLTAIVIFTVFLAGGIYVIETGEQRAQQVELAQIDANAQKASEVVALEQQAEVAKAGFVANAAIAASGDLAQASMVKSFKDAIWGIGFIIAGMVALMLYMDHRKDRQRKEQGIYQPHYVSNDVWDYKNK